MVSASHRIFTARDHCLLLPLLNSARDQQPLHNCLGCNALIFASSSNSCSHQRCLDCCQRLPLPCLSHPRQAVDSPSLSEHAHGVVVAELEHGLLLVQVTRDDGLHYSGLLATDESILVDVTPLPSPPLLSDVVDAPVSAATSTSASAVGVTDSGVAPVKRKYVRSGIYSKKIKVACRPPRPLHSPSQPSTNRSTSRLQSVAASGGRLLRARLAPFEHFLTQGCPD